MTSIFVMIKRIYRYQIKSNYLRNDFAFVIAFLELTLNFDYFERKKEPRSLIISEVIDSK